MKEVFLVKQAVDGRTFIHTGQHALEYEVVKTEEGHWNFKVNLPMDDRVKEILRCRQELNVFLFREFEDQPTRKIWFYVKEGPVEYHSDHQQLMITAHSCIEYVPEQFTFTS